MNLNNLTYNNNNNNRQTSIMPALLKGKYSIKLKLPDSSYIVEHFNANYIC